MAVVEETTEESPRDRIQARIKELEGEIRARTESRIKELEGELKEAGVPDLSNPEVLNELRRKTAEQFGQAPLETPSGPPLLGEPFEDEGLDIPEATGQDLLVLQKRAQQQALIQDRATKVLAEHPNAFIRNLMFGAGLAGGDILSTVSRVTGIGDADKLARQAQVASAIQSEANRKDVGVVPASVSDAFAGSMRSITEMIAGGGTISPWNGIATAALIRGNQALTEATDADLKGGKRLKFAGRAALIEGGVAGVLQKFGLGGVESVVAGKAVWKGVTEALRGLGKTLLQEIPEELLTEALDNWNQAFSSVDLQATSLENQIRTAIATILQTIMTVGITSGVKSGTGIIFNKLADTPPTRQGFAKALNVSSKDLGEGVNTVAGREEVVAAAKEFASAPPPTAEFAVAPEQPPLTLTEEEIVQPAATEEAGIPRTEVENVLPTPDDPEATVAPEPEHPIETDLERPARSTTTPEPVTDVPQSKATLDATLYAATSGDLGGLPPDQPRREIADRSPSASIISLPDMVQFFKDVSGGQLPRIMPRLKARGGAALGVLRVKEGEGATIDLRADIFLGPVVGVRPVRKVEGKIQIPREEQVQKAVNDVAETGNEDVSNLVGSPFFDKKGRRWIIKVQRRDPTFALKIFGHEIGHYVDFLTGKTMKRGNILGRIASFKKMTNSFLPEVPEQPMDNITPDETKAMRAEADKVARQSITIKGEGRDEAVRLEKDMVYMRLLQSEMERRSLFSKQDITAELRELTQWWNPFDETLDKNYTAERYSSPELYAEAFSVLMNNQEALQHQAPQFHAALFNWISQKPEAQKAWNDLQVVLKEGTSTANVLERSEQAYERVTGAVKELAENRRQKRTWTDMWLDIKMGYVTKMARLGELQGKVNAPPEENPVYLAQNMIWGASEQQGFMRDINRSIDLPLAKLDVENKHRHLYLQWRRAATERSDIANPGGVGGQDAVNQLLELKKKIGDTKYNALVQAGDEYFRIAKKWIFPKLFASGLIDSEAKSLFLANENYVNFFVESKIDEFTAAESDPTIKKQYGTFQEVDDVFFRTTLKHMALLRQAARNASKLGTVKAYEQESGDTIQAERRFDSGGKPSGFKPPKEKGKVLFEYKEDGELKGKYIPEKLAEFYNTHSPEEVNLALHSLNLTKELVRKVWIEYSPAFLRRNIERDLKTNLKTLPRPEGTMFNEGDILKEYAKNRRDVWTDIRTGVPSPLIEEMYAANMFIVDRGWTGISDKDVDPYHALQREISSFPDKTDSAIKNGLLWLPRWMSDLNKWSERIGQVARYSYLKRHMNNQTINITPQEVAHLVRQAGSPDFKDGGTKKGIIGSLFIFANPDIQGKRQHYSALKRDPTAYLLKTALYDVLPTTLMALASAGVLGKVAELILGDEDGEWDWLEKTMGKFSSYSKKNYIVVPVGTTEDGEAIGLQFPHDFEASLLTHAMWTALEQKDGFLLKEAGDSLRRVNPFDSDGLNPLIGLVLDSLNVGFGGNPYDSYYGRNILTEQTRQEGGMRAWKELGKYHWNKNFSSLMKVKGTTQAETKNAFIRAMDMTPFLGNLVKSTLIITSKGERDAMRRQEEVNKREPARESLKRGDIAKKSTSLLSGDSTVEEIERVKAELYAEAREAGVVGGVTSNGFAGFSARIDRIVQHKFGNNYEQTTAYMTASEKAALYEWGLETGIVDGIEPPEVKTEQDYILSHSKRLSSEVKSPDTEKTPESRRIARLRDTMARDDAVTWFKEKGFEKAKLRQLYRKYLTRKFKDKKVRVKHLSNFTKALNREGIQ